MANLLRSLLTIAALVAAAAFVPSQALAHPGHEPVKVHAPAVKHDAAKASVPQELRAAQPQHNNADDPACADRGCCGNGACSACFSSIAPSVAVEFPPAAHSQVRPRDGPAVEPFAPEGLKRPPKLFV